MDLQEFSDWLSKQMREKGITGNARIEWIDVSNCKPEHLDLAYDSENNAIIITEI